MSVIKGKDVILYFDYGGDNVVCCFRSCTLNTTAILAETSTVGTGRWRTLKGVSLEWDGSCEGLISLNDNVSISQISAVQFSLQPINIKFVRTDIENSLEEIFASQCLIRRITTSGSFGGAAEYSVEVDGIGGIEFEIPPPDIPDGCELRWYYYNGVGGEFTTGPIPEIVGQILYGYITRDGVQYRPSGLAHDGSAAPDRKEFSFNPSTGAIGFNELDGPIQPGEFVDIPYIWCPGDTTCVGISIGNIIQSPGNTSTSTLPNATVGVQYSIHIQFNGSSPFNVTDLNYADWLTYVPSGTGAGFFGTPEEGDVGNHAISFNVNNCNGESNASFNQNFDVIDEPEGNANWTYINNVGVQGRFRILVNGDEVVNVTSNNSGSLNIPTGASVSIIVQSDFDGFGHLEISGAYTYNEDVEHINTEDFTMPSGTINIIGESNPEPAP